VAEKTKIEWTARRNPDGTVTPGATWTPLQARRLDNGKTGVHCVKVSPECKNCYSETFNKRTLPQHGTGLPFTVLSTEKVEMFLNEDILMQPLKWRRPRTIFVCSQTDLFGEFVEDFEIAQVFAVMALAHGHRHLVLTKRAERMNSLLTSEDFWELVDSCMTVIVDGEVDPLERSMDDLRATAPEVGADIPLPNVWIGVTAGTQKSADERIPWLLKTPAAKRFVSAEPLLEAVDLMWPDSSNKAEFCCGGTWMDECGCQGRPVNMPLLYGIDWVIAGGESGPGARPMHPAWARSLRDQCSAAGVAYFFKQWGDWLPAIHNSGLSDQWTSLGPKRPMKGYLSKNGSKVTGPLLTKMFNPDGLLMVKIGKRAAGRLLDGREWNEVPNA
jgi:protein gp37